MCACVEPARAATGLPIWAKKYGGSFLTSGTRLLAFRLGIGELRDGHRARRHGQGAGHRRRWGQRIAPCLSRLCRRRVGTRACRPQHLVPSIGDSRPRPSRRGFFCARYGRRYGQIAVNQKFSHYFNVSLRTMFPLSAATSSADPYQARRDRSPPQAARLHGAPRAAGCAVFADRRHLRADMPIRAFARSWPCH
jgi:hypothetical protein